MEEQFDEQLEDEYVAQQEVAEPIRHAIPAVKQEKKPDLEIAALLIDISEMLKFLHEQIALLNEVTQTVPEAVSTLQATTAAVQCIADELPATVKNQCLGEYKKVLENAVKNYNQMQKAADNWQKDIKEKKQIEFKIITVSAIMTPVLLILLVLLK